MPDSRLRSIDDAPSSRAANDAYHKAQATQLTILLAALLADHGPLTVDERTVRAFSSGRPPRIVTTLDQRTGRYSLSLIEDDRV